MVNIIFENVGNSRRETISWEAQLKTFNGQSILHEIKRQRVIDGEPDIWYDNERTHGKIFVGGYKLVGSFRVIPEYKTIAVKNPTGELGNHRHGML